jgi:hypothetical protein
MEEELQEPLSALTTQSKTSLGRWGAPLHRDGRTGVRRQMWGADTVDALLNLAPDNGFDDEPRAGPH